MKRLNLAIREKNQYIVESYVHRSFFINHRQTQILYNAPLWGATEDIYSAIASRINKIAPQGDN